MEQDYLAALKSDLAASMARYPQLKQRELVSIFIGGGTPSLLSASFYADLLSALSNEFILDATTEITIEANPGSSEQSKFAAYRQMGINRISLGAQSFNNKKLAALGRVHRAEDSVNAYHSAVAAGFTRINLDIMFALPNQSCTDAMEDLRRAIELAPEHISRYQLTLEPNTLFAVAPPPGLPAEELVIAMEEEGGHLLRDHGFAQYEVSAWAHKSTYKSTNKSSSKSIDSSRPQRISDAANSCVPPSADAAQARHNLNYWRFGDYLGLGAGAHSKISLLDASISDSCYGVHRERKHRSPDKYMREESRVAGVRKLSSEELVYEFMLNALRLVGGFPLSLFCETTGLDPLVLQDNLQRGVDLGLLLVEEVNTGGTPTTNAAITENAIIKWVKPSQRGMQMLDDAIILFSPSSSSNDTNAQDGLGNVDTTRATRYIGATNTAEIISKH